MMKRVISGLFLLIALGALGFILAGALKSGEQLIVRFLTAIIVTALGLYVISDLRLKADDSAVAKGERSSAAGSQSTAAYMATVTRRTPAVAVDDPASDGLSVTDLTADPLGTGGLWAPRTVADGARSATERPELAKADERMLRVASRPIEAEIDDSLSPDYHLQDDEVRQWPLTAEHPVVKIAAAADSPRVDEDITRPLASRRLLLAGDDHHRDGHRNRLHDSADDDRDETGDAAPAVFDTGEIEKLVDQLAIGGPPAPGPAGTSPFGRLNPAGGLGLLERSSVDTGTPATTTTGSTATEAVPTALPQAHPVAAPAPETPAGPVSPLAGNEPTAASTPAPTPIRPARPTLPTSPSTLAAADYTRAPLAGVVNLRPRRIAPPNAIEAAIRSGELEVIASLIDQGLLSTEGPISDRDVRTMVYVAFTSSELRKILLSGGTLDGDNSDIDLGEVDVFYRPSTAGTPSLSQPPAEPIDAEPSAASALPVEVIDLRDAEPVRARAL